MKLHKDYICKACKKECYTYFGVYWHNVLRHRKFGGVTTGKKISCFIKLLPPFYLIFILIRLVIALIMLAFQIITVIGELADWVNETLFYLGDWLNNFYKKI